MSSTCQCESCMLAFPDHGSPVSPSQRLHRQRLLPGGPDNCAARSGRPASPGCQGAVSRMSAVTQAWPPQKTLQACAAGFCPCSWLRAGCWPTWAGNAVWSTPGCCEVCLASRTQRHQAYELLRCLQYCLAGPRGSAGSPRLSRPCSVVGAPCADCHTTPHRCCTQTQDKAHVAEHQRS